MHAVKTIHNHSVKPGIRMCKTADNFQRVDRIAIFIPSYALLIHKKSCPLGLINQFLNHSYFLIKGRVLI